MKPTCMLQISQKHIAVATGFLNERSRVEVVNIFSGQVSSVISHHSDMIDSMRLLDLSKYTQSLRQKKKKQRQGSSSSVQGGGEEAVKSGNPFVRWMVTIGRDYKMVIWKLIDGVLMHTDLALPLYHAQQEALSKAERKKSMVKSTPTEGKRRLMQLAPEYRSSVKLLSVHRWFYELTPEAKREINSQFTYDFI
mmetsp:Transcript_23938/g.36647  ORF Transcript_23938/g.36647 Transcript_23938/m.36647 type:complete len:194 (+) Transcript_23938:1693-2274(+)